MCDEKKLQDNQKVCFNECPECGETDDIEWFEKDYSGTQIFQSATCNKCGRQFEEIYEYTCTESNDKKPLRP